MADYSVTAASVLASLNSTKVNAISGASITAGMAVYKDLSNGQIKLADANSATAAVRTPIGIALNGASSGQPVTYVTVDPNFTPGFTVAAGEIVTLASDTAGALCPSTDLAPGDYTTIVGLGVGGNQVKLAFLSAGAVNP